MLTSAPTSRNPEPGNGNEVKGPHSAREFDASEFFSLTACALVGFSLRLADGQPLEAAVALNHETLARQWMIEL